MPAARRDAPVVLRERRQVRDLPPVRRRIARTNVARLRASLPMLRKRGHTLITALESLFTGQPLYPTCA